MFKNHRNAVRRLSIAGCLATVAGSAFADGTSPMAGIFAAVDLTSVVAFVGTAGVTIVGIALALKGISLAKRAVGKA